MKKHLLTYVLLFLVLETLGLTFARQGQNTSNNVKDPLKQEQERKSRFPTAEYEEPDLADAAKNRIRKEKGLRHNDFQIVDPNPPAWAAEVVATVHDAMNFPALPVSESEYIVIGKVTAAEAHVSANKKNVYSEFTVSISKVFKTATSSVVDGSEIAVSRNGGFVKYPNGKRVLYRTHGFNMPAVGENYLFFLTSKKNQDLTILTAYVLGVDGVEALDQSELFQALEGLTEEALFQKLNESLVKSSSY